MLLWDELDKAIFNSQWEPKQERNIGKNIIEKHQICSNLVVDKMSWQFSVDLSVKTLSDFASTRFSRG